ncbi:helix-turn-helix transcriptional regulator [Amycolatopsis regifaucium]|uniref:Helix-turn-helix transcriptional regulator n=1 Tax=Amycolatopsis regifaucium TaxID=546365 RepID=A0A154M6I7_9PSEU|nr:helix-turn-helix transcriptional regulator [Amycolatopsis regifaucium]KZB80156.1 helix-turn-helix transcriptional regulator [Amycolatopsis regifaucium]OKA09473.1 helix-turn-helix transcriptional regulator [Amycolatopsis regifaucium]SFH62581.1 regulatory protein, luxR family [Amycolatopsis regifaucium]
MNALLDKPGIIHPDARRLLDEVIAAPELPVRVTVVAPGGHGKTHLLGLLGRHYASAGVEALLIDDADQLDDDGIAKIKARADETTVPVVLAGRTMVRTKALRALADSFGRSVSLGAFGVEDVRRLVEQAGGDPATAGDVHARTGGVPRLVLRAVTGQLADFRAELEQLDDDVHRYLIAAEAGAGRNLDLLAALLNRDRDGLPEIFDGARATGLLGEDDVLLPIAAEAVRTWGSPGRRLTVLQRLVELQLREGLPVLELARSLLGTGSSGASAAAAFEAAAREAMPDDTKLAARFYEAASEAGGRGAALTVGWAHAAALAGDLDTALRLGDGLLGNTDDPDGVDARAAGAEVAGTVLAHRGELAHSAELYQWSGRAGSKAFAAIALVGTGKLEAARDVLETPEVPTLFAGAASRMARAITDSVSGCGSETLSALLGAASMLESAGAPAPLPDSPAALAALVGLHSGELALAESVLARAVNGRIGGDLLAKRHRLLRGWVAMTSGDLKTAAEAMMPPDGLEARDELFAATLQLGLARRASDLPGLQRSWDRAYQASMRQQPDLYSLLPLGELTIAAARAGASAKLAGQLERAHTLLDALGNPPLWTATLRWHELHAAITVENHSLAEEHLAALHDFASCGRYPAALAAAATGWLAVLTGNFDPEPITVSAAELHELGLCWDASRLAGQAAIRTSDRKAMVQLLEAARQFQGRAPEPVAATGLSALSERELEVARLVVDGLTYKQAGSKLFISGKTVEHHMARIRGKLGAGDRRELLAMLRELLPATEA